MNIKFINGKPRNNGKGATNIEILKMAGRMKLSNFKYYMRDELIGKEVLDVECGVVNLEDSSSDGSHHCC